MTNEPNSKDANSEINDSQTSATSANRARSLYSRPSLSRGFDSYAQPQEPTHDVSDASYSNIPYSEAAIPKTATGHTTGHVEPQSYRTESPRHQDQMQRRRFAWLRLWRTKQKQIEHSPAVPLQPVPAQSPYATRSPYGSPLQPPLQRQPVDHSSYRPDHTDTDSRADPLGDSYRPYNDATDAQHTDVALPLPPRFWQRQPYVAIAYLLLSSGALTLAWIFGLLSAQIFSGEISSPPLQEGLLRKSSRLSNRLWHFPELWHTPTVQSRIEAIPLPETGPILEPLTLSPIERQPLVDELNSIETELLTLDRRLQAIEKKLGKPPYQGTGINSRLNALRAAIDPPVQALIEPDYEPVATPPDEQLLEVAKLKITLPSDALFAPGQSNLKADSLLSQVLDQLVNYPNATISIRSYSDDQGDAIASREYTLAQANTLAAYLRTSLPSTHRWITVGMGQAQPVTENVDAIARQQNRRLEILVDNR